MEMPRLCGTAGIGVRVDLGLVRGTPEPSSWGTNLKVKSRAQGGLKMQEVILKKMGLKPKEGSDLPAQKSAALSNICKHKEIREEMSGHKKGLGVSQ